MRFRPTLWATLAVIPLLAMLIGLGVWQLQRLDWKRDLIALRAERVVSPALDLVPRSRIDNISDPNRFGTRLSPQSGIETISADPAAFEYRPIRLAGAFRHDGAIHLVSRIHDGQVGEQLVTPLVLATGSVVLVDRGWVPPRGAGGTPQRYDRSDGAVVVDGYIRLFAPPGRFTPDNEPATDTWFWLDSAAIAQLLGTPVVGAFYVQSAPDDAATAQATPPIGSIPDIALRNPHLQYALIWFGVAAALAGVYVAFHIRRRD
jgi:surfeit locus 1 family protein